MIPILIENRIDMLSEVATGVRGKEYLNIVGKLCDKWPALILKDKTRTINFFMDENRYAEDLLRQIFFNYWKNMNPVKAKEWADNYSELQDALDKVIKIVKRIASNPLKERIMLDDLFFDYFRLIEDNNYVDQISSLSLYGTSKYGTFVHLSKMSRDFITVPRAMLAWAEAESRIYEPIKKKRAGRPQDVAKAVLISELLKYLFSIQGKRPELPSSTTVTKDNISYDQMLTSMKNYTFIMDILKAVSDEINKPTGIDIIRDQWRNISWDDDPRLKLLIYVEDEEEWEQ